MPERAVGSYELEMQVRLVIPDSTAITARQVLRRLGLTCLVELHRLDRWCFTFEGDRRDRDETALRLQYVDVLVNANKHRAIVAPPALEAMSARRAAPPIPAGARSAWVAVTTTPDARAEGAAPVLRDRLGFTGLVHARRDDLWRLDLAVESADEARECAVRAIDLLLANRQFQRSEVYDGWS